ncbi:MAG: hypothetical protein LJE75_04680 [Gammaproteobacteria bacterium]|jgi:hypothetical protein|nr:hypothetical protein [Gammaproteobacteria bacterium]
MSEPLLFSIIESPLHPDFSALYQRLGICEVKLGSMRKAISALKSRKPDIVVAEFMYGYGNNYAGVNVSNLDVFLYSLQKYSRESAVVVMVDQCEVQYVDKLRALFPIHAVLQHPVGEQELAVCLGNWSTEN